MVMPVQVPTWAMRVRPNSWTLRLNRSTEPLDALEARGVVRTETLPSEEAATMRASSMTAGSWSVCRVNSLMPSSRRNCLMKPTENLSALRVGMVVQAP